MRTSASHCVHTLLALMAIALGNAASAANVSLWVSNHGTDSNGCGSPTNPCRSISQAIENATDGDTIWVGPGHYGNVNGDVGFTGPGDEHPMPTVPDFAGLFEGTGCIVCINKAVHVYSTSGAAATVIDSGSLPPYNATVMVTADGAAFGYVGRGFTITGGNAIGVALYMDSWQGSKLGVVIAGNVDLKDSTGFEVYGPTGYYHLNCPPDIPQACPGFGGVFWLYQNQASHNGTGFWIRSRNAFSLPSTHKSVQFLIQNNVTRAAGTGFHIESGQICGDCTPLGPASEVLTIHNFATNGGVGFYLRQAGPAKDNFASDNSQYGFLSVGSSGPFVHNSAIGNAGPGIVTGLDAGTPSFGLSLQQNNFFNNDRNRPVLSLGEYGPPYDYDPGPSAHCGVLNMGAVWQSYALDGGSHLPPAPPVPSVTLQATNNYWGSSSGPSSAGAGDAAGGVCDQNNAVTITKPFATTAVTITALP